MAHLSFRTQVSEQRTISVRINIDPCSPGSAHCCFERSNLPDHRGTRTLVMRILKITTPVISLLSNYTGGVPKPVEGELVMKRATLRNSRVEFWSIDVDKLNLPALHDLYRDG